MAYALNMPDSENSICLPSGEQRGFTKGKNIQEKTTNLPKSHESY